MTTIIIIAILVVIAVYTVISYRKRLSNGCCGAGDGESVKKVKAADRDPSHYPIHKQLKIDGMTCGKCAQRVENAFNGKKGMLAKVTLEQELADLYLKEEHSDEELKELVREAGYRAYKIISM